MSDLLLLLTYLYCGSNCLSVCLTACLSVSLFVCSYVCLCACLFVCSYVCLLVCVWLSVCLSVRLFIHVCLPVCLFACLSLFVCLSVHLFICLSICLFVHLFICLSICLFVCSFVHMSVHLFICLSVCLPVGRHIPVYKSIYLCKLLHRISSSLQVVGKVVSRTRSRQIIFPPYHPRSRTSRNRTVIAHFRTRNRMLQLVSRLQQRRQRKVPTTLIISCHLIKDRPTKFLDAWICRSCFELDQKNKILMNACLLFVCLSVVILHKVSACYW